MTVKRKYNPLLCRHPNIPLNLQFLEGSGDTVYDLSGNANNGTIVNAVWTSTDHGWALDFNGSDTYALVSDSNSIDITQAITIESLVKKTDVSGVEAVIRKDGAYLLRFFDDVVHAYFASDGWKYAKSSTTVSVGEYYHVVTTYDSGDGVRKPHIYLNGDEVSYTHQQVLPGLISTNTNDLYIGSFNGGNEWFEGLIFLVRVYNRAISAAEVKSSYLDLRRRLRI